MERNRWYKDAFIYQIYPRSFKDSNDDGIGDIKGIIEKLDYLSFLGIDAVWLSPVYKSPNDDNGYDISDYRNIMDDFGTLDDWKLMISEMHKRNIKLIMDLVINHTSDEHNWFKEARKDVNSPYRDYYFFRKGIDGKKPNNWTSFFGGDAWEYNPDTDDYYLHLFTKKQPDLNYNNPKVMEEIKSIINYWLELGVDGFRCDVITLISKDKELPNGKWNIALVGKEHYLNGKHIHEYLHELYLDAFSKYNAMTVGESVLMNVDTAPYYVKEDREELDSLFTFEHMDVDNFFGVKYLMRKFKLKRLKKVLSKWQDKMYGIGWNSLYLENHDQPRSIGRFNTKLEYHDLGCKMLATMIYFLQGTPYIYQGQEIGMTNGDFKTIEDFKDTETLNILKVSKKMGIPKSYIMKAIFKRSRDNARTPMQWDDSKNAGFTKGIPWIKVNNNYKNINVKANIENDDSVLNYYRKLISIRKNNDIVRNGKYIEHYKKSKNLYVYSRVYEDKSLLVITNFSDKNQKFDLMDEFRNKKSKCLLANYGDVVDINSFLLRPYEARVYYFE